MWVLRDGGMSASGGFVLLVGWIRFLHERLSGAVGRATRR